MDSDVLWIMTDEAITAEVVLGERDSQVQGNPYDLQPVKSVLALSAEKLKRGWWILLAWWARFCNTRSSDQPTQ